MMASAMSTALTVGPEATDTAIGLGTAAGAGLGAPAAAGAAALGRGGLGAWAGAAAAALIGAPGAPAPGPPGGKVGSLIVGAADGFGGKLIRTVSFFGWTFPVSFFGGTAPAGPPGIFSAIALLSP
jgi:hypothetical protein